MRGGTRLRIVRYQHGEGDFWQRMGPFLVSSAVRRELGTAITSDEHTVWWLAIDDENRAIGFAAARCRKDVCEMRHAYVIPEARGQGVYHALCEARLSECREWGARIARATVNARSLPVYLDLGFRPVSTRGQYTIVEKELTA